MVYLKKEIDCCKHYENMPMQYTDFSEAVKSEKFQLKNLDIFLAFVHNIAYWVHVRTASQRQFQFFFSFFSFLIQFNIPFKIISAHIRRANQ